MNQSDISVKTASYYDKTAKIILKTDLESESKLRFFICNNYGKYYFNYI